MAGCRSLPPGAKIAVIEGKMTAQARSPRGSSFRPTTGSLRIATQERVTVLSGTVNIGMGDKFDAGGPPP